MLREIANVAQRRGDPLRTWFTDDELDLILWQGTDNRMVGFQLVYDKKGDSRAITWQRGQGFQHHRVDDGEPAILGLKQTPVLTAEGSFDHLAIKNLFVKRSMHLDTQIAGFIASKLNGFPNDDEQEPPLVKIRTYLGATALGKIIPWNQFRAFGLLITIVLILLLFLAAVFGIV